jgi:hypothetical protein
MCRLSKIKFPNQKRSISVTSFRLSFDSMDGHELYSFMDGYSNYNQVKMAEEDKEKTTFIS